MGKRPLALGCLVVVFLLYLACLLSPKPYEGYSGYQDREVTVTGKVFWKERKGQPDGQVLVLYLKDLPDAEPSGEKVMCYLRSGQSEPGMGSRITLSGKLKAFEQASNPGQFDAYSYYQISGISYRLNQAIILEQSTEYDPVKEGLYRFRCFLGKIFTENLPEKESALMKTILLGEKGELDRQLKAVYQRNGIAHILAISGLHVSMLGMGLYRLLRRFGVPMKAAAVLAALVLILYGIMTGFSVSAIRAILMFTLHMLAIAVERTYDLLTALAVTAVLLLVKQPLYFYHSGFVFSFGCVLGIALVQPALTEQKAAASKALLSAFGMAVITLPLYLWFYYQFPPYSVLLNLLIIPLMSYLMAAGLVLLLLGIVWKPLTTPIVFMISGIFRIYEAACQYSEKMPAHLLNVGKPEGWQLCLYLTMLLSAVLLKKKTSLFLRWSLVLAAVFLLLLRPRGSLTITFLDVGQGDSIYLESAEGSRFLIDGGSSSVSGVGEYRLIPFLKYCGTRQLKAVFVTHSDEDHCNGIKELLEEGKLHGISVGCLVLPDISESSKEEAYRELEAAAVRERVPIQYISAGQQIREKDLTITCLHPKSGYETKEANEYSMVLDVDYGNFRMLLTGDLEGEGERRLLQSLEKQDRKSRGRFQAGQRKYTVLKAAHHGSAYSTSEEFLDQILPVYTIISCGENNPYGHPHKELLDRLADVGSRVLATPECGAIRLEVRKGEELKVHRFIKEADTFEPR